jgi:hypothetical protein
MAAPVPARPERPWGEIAKEITCESDPGKVLHLTEELNRALAQQLPRRPVRSSATDGEGISDPPPNRDSNRIAS